MMQEKIKIDPYLLTAIVRYLGKPPTSIQDLYPIKRLLCGESRSPLGGYLASQGVPTFLSLERGAWEPVRWMGKLRTFEVHRYLVNDYSFLKDCRNLESLSVMPPQRQAFDCTLLQEMPWLHSAELIGFDLLHPEKLVDPQPLTFPVHYDPPAWFPMFEGLPAAIRPEEKTLPSVPDGSTEDFLLCWVETERTDAPQKSPAREVQLLHACRSNVEQAAEIARKLGEGTCRWAYGTREYASLHIQWGKGGAVLEYHRDGQRLLWWNKRAKSWKGYLCKNAGQIEQALLYFCRTGKPFPGVCWAVLGGPPKI